MSDEMDELVKDFADAVERLAFEMPAPNAYTPRFMQLAITARNQMHTIKAGRALNMKYGEGGRFGPYVAGYMAAMDEARKIAAEAGNTRPSE